MTATTTTQTATQPDQPPVTLRSPADLVAATPYLLHFHPTDSVVMLAFGGKALVGVARVDLPDPADADPVGRGLVEMMLSREATMVAILGYGSADRVDPVVPAIRSVAEQRGLEIKDALRVDAGRWWSYVCQSPACCPPEGTPFDPATSEVSARLAFEGVTTAPSRGDLERQVAPIGGLTRASMTQATVRAEGSYLEWLGTVPDGEWPAVVLAEGTAVVQRALQRYGEGGTLDDDEVAWLTVLLAYLPVRDVAWQAITSEQPHLSLWTDVVRRVDPALVPGPACLLAFTAWRFGNGVLAGLALERALREDAHYSLAILLSELLRQGPPSPEFAHWGTPEWDTRMDRFRRPAPQARTPRPRRRKRGRARRRK